MTSHAFEIEHYAQRVLGMASNANLTHGVRRIAQHAILQFRRGLYAFEVEEEARRSSERLLAIRGFAIERERDTNGFGKDDAIDRQ